MIGLSDGSSFDITESCPCPLGAQLTGSGFMGPSFYAQDVMFAGTDYGTPISNFDVGLPMRVTGTPFTAAPGTITLPFTASGLFLADVPFDRPVVSLRVPVSGSGLFTATFVLVDLPPVPPYLYARDVTYDFFVPEPSTWALLAGAVFWFAMYHFRCAERRSEPEPAHQW
jgi:hypothetical protein